MHTFGPRTGKARSRLLIPVLIATHAIYQRRVGYWPPRAPRKTAPCCPAACWWEPVPWCRECLLPRLLVIFVSSFGDDQCFAGFGLLPQVFTSPDAHTLRHCRWSLWLPAP